VGTPNIRHISLAQQRRSQRVLLSVPLLVSGVHENRTTFSERATTSVVNAHGALPRLRERVEMEQVLRLKNIATGEELDCKVADVSRGQDERVEVGVEFLEPSSRFWRISFPPVDWSQRSPEAKRFVGRSPEATLPAKK
jgi:hypothetical protein